MVQRRVVKIPRNVMRRMVKVGCKSEGKDKK